MGADLPVREAISRHLIIEGTRCSVGANHEDELLAPYYARVDFQGRLHRAWDGVSRAEVWVTVGEERMTSAGRSVGSAIVTKPFISFGIGTTTQQFDRLWQLAVSGHCRSVHLRFRPMEWGIILYGWYVSSTLPEVLFTSSDHRKSDGPATKL
jgi:hypothetical protein